MAEYPTRQFSASQAYNAYMQSLEEEEERKKAYNIVHQMHKLTNPHYAGSSAENRNLSKISKLGSGTSSGLATRLRLMTAADKENLGIEFTGAFQQALESDLFTSLKSFNTWANKQGPWYDEDLRKKHATTVKDLLAAQQSSKVAEAVDTLFGKYNDEWITGSYTEQNQVRQNIADSDAIKNLPSKWRAAAVDEVIKMLNTFLSPTGRDAAAIEARRVAGEARSVISAAETTEKHKAGITKTATDKSRNLIASGISSQAATCVLEGDGSPEAREACFQQATAKWAETFPEVVKQVSEDARKRFNAAVEKPTAPPGTKPVYDPATDSTIFATDAEIAADNSLVPTAAESNLDPDTARIGALMAVKGEMPNDVWKKYYKGGMDLLYNSLVGPDAEHIKKWLLEVEEYKAKKAAGVNINYQMLNPNSSGQATGRTDDGIKNVIVSPNQ